MRISVYCWLLFSACVCNAQEEIVMVFGGEYPPYYDNKQSSGMFIELLNGFKKTHPQYVIRIETLSRKRIDLWIMSGKADAFSLATEAFVPNIMREHFIASEVIWETSDRLVSRASSPLSYQNQTSLKTAKIGTIVGNRYMQVEKLFNSGDAYRVDFYDIKAQFEAVLANNIDAMIINQHSIKHYIDLYNYDVSLLHVSRTPLYSFGLSTMISKNKQGFLNAFNRYIKKAKHNGTLANIESRYSFKQLASAIAKQ